jgi:hypothetical protein
MSDKVNAWLALLPPEDVNPGGRVKSSTSMWRRIASDPSAAAGRVGSRGEGQQIAPARHYRAEAGRTARRRPRPDLTAFAVVALRCGVAA